MTQYFEVGKIGKVRLERIEAEILDKSVSPDQYRAVCEYDDCGWATVGNIDREFANDMAIEHDDLHKRVCEVCGCSEMNACVDDDSGERCSWIGKTLCSFCGNRVGKFGGVFQSTKERLLG